MESPVPVKDDSLLPALRPHRFLDPHLYILHLVQFGVTVGAERTRVRLLRSGVVEVLFPGAKPDFSLEKLVNAVSQEHQLPSGRSLSKLVQALRMAGRLKPRELSWNMPNQAQLCFKEGALEQRRADGPLGFRLQKKPQRWFQAWHGQESRLLNERCCWTPNQLTVDGREVRCSAWDRFQLFTTSEAWEEKLQPYPVESFRRRQAAALKVPGPPSNYFEEAVGCCRWTGKLPSSLLFRSYTRPVRFRSDQAALDQQLSGDLGVAVVDRNGGPSRLWLVQDGVALEPVEIDLGAPRLVAVVHAPEVSVDETGFQPFKDTVSERLLDEVAAEGRALLEWLDDQAG